LNLYLHNSLSSDLKPQKSPLIDPFKLINLNFKELIMEHKDIEHFKKILTNQLKELLIHALTAKLKKKLMRMLLEHEYATFVL